LSRQADLESSFLGLYAQPSQEAKVAMYAAKPVVFATRLLLSERKPLALVLEKFQKTEQAAFLDPCGQTFSSLLQASDFLIGNKK